MPRRVATTTISLPKPMAQKLKLYAKQQGRTVSDIIREALIRTHPFLTTRKKTNAEWKKLEKELDAVAKMGEQIPLSEFIIQDRQSH